MASHEKNLLQKTDSNRKLEFVQRLFRDRTSSIVAQKPETPWERAERSRIEQSTLRFIADQIGFRLKSFPFSVEDQGQEHQVSVVKGGRIFKGTFLGKFGLHHMAHFRDPARLALEMGHTSQVMIHRHYKALVTPQEGEKYWNLKPKQNAKA